VNDTRRQHAFLEYPASGTERRILNNVLQAAIFHYLTTPVPQILIAQYRLFPLPIAGNLYLSDFVKIALEEQSSGRIVRSRRREVAVAVEVDIVHFRRLLASNVYNPVW
jgi:hypothetical protein